MVTVLKIDQLKYKINQRDHNPPHVHVEGPGGATLRVNLITFEPMDGETEFSSATVQKILMYVANNASVLREKWIEFHGGERDED